MGTNPYEADKELLVGKDVPWDHIRQRFLLVRQFTPFASLEDGKINGPGGFTPYGLFGGTCEADLQPLMVPITHKVDFQRAWDIFRVRGIEDNEEGLVVYAPQSGLFSAFKARFAFRVFPKGWLQAVLEDKKGEDNPYLIRAILRYDP